MRNTIIAGVLMWGMAASSPLFAQATADDAAQLRQKVKQLEQQVQQLEQELKPLKAQQAAQNRQRTLRERFNQRVAQDEKKYTQEQLREAENMYLVASRNSGSSKASENLEAVVKKYPDVNRTGCATLDVAESSRGDERAKYLQDCIKKYNDCFFGDGAQVGAYARFLLAEDYRRNGAEKKATALYTEIKTMYADAIDHHGNRLVDRIKTDSK